MRKKVVWRVAAVACAAVLALGILAPYLNANIFRERIRTALEAALHRRVELGAVHFNLFTGPGFSVNDVLISDDTSAGIEPFAHVTTLQARLQLKSFFTGRLAFSRLRLVDPSVNLVKTDAGPWNVQAFFQRATSPEQHSGHDSFPDIQIVDGRIDFKFGLVKSVFYINNADVDIYPNFRGDLVVNFSGEPARTDRAAQALGRVSARGLLQNPGRAEDHLTMALQLERSSLSELAGLFNSGDMGVHGHISSNATLSGPLSHITISGSLNVSDLHRWDLMPAQGEGWTLNYRGLLETQSQKFYLETTAAPEDRIPVALKFKATDFISALKWAASMTLTDLPASSLVETARHLGAPLPADVRVDGKVNGGISVSSPGGLQGGLALSSASFKFAGAGSASIDSANIVVAGNRFSIGPADLMLENGHSARIQASYDGGAQDLTMEVATRLLTASDMRTGIGGLIDVAAIPVLANCRQGSWSGTVRYERKSGAPEEWSGNFDVQNAQVDLDGMAAPLRLSSAALEFEHGKVQIKGLRGRLGAIGIQADYRFDMAGGPQVMRVTAAQADVAELERLFMPTLRRKQGLLADLRLRRPTLPQWLKDRDVEGAVIIKQLSVEDAPVCEFKSRLAWKGAVVQFANASCAQGEASATGRVTVNLAGSLPRYELAGQVENLDYHDGTLDFDGQFNTSGTGQDLLLHATSQGTFDGRDIVLSADTTLTEISGAFLLNPGITGPRLVLSKVEASDSVETFTGQGASMADGHLVLDLTTAAKRQVKLTGSLLPLQPVAR